MYIICVLCATVRLPLLYFCPMAPAVEVSPRRTGYKSTHHSWACVTKATETKKNPKKVTQKQTNVSEKVFVCVCFISFFFLSIFSTLTFHSFSTIKHRGWSQLGKRMKRNNNTPFILFYNIFVLYLWCYPDLSLCIFPLNYSLPFSVSTFFRLQYLSSKNCLYKYRQRHVLKTIKIRGFVRL